MQIKPIRSSNRIFVCAGVEHCINSDQILELDEIPKRLAVIGAGYIGLEFGGIFKNLGSHVEFFLRRDKVLNGFDEDVRAPPEYCEKHCVP